MRSYFCCITTFFLCKSYRIVHGDKILNSSIKKQYTGYNFENGGFRVEEQAIVQAPVQSHYSQDGYSQFSRQPRPNTAAPVINPLLKQSTAGFVGLLFGLLMWRSISAYELADQVVDSTWRLITVTPTVLLLLANIVGFLVNIIRPLNFKNQLKLILVCNILRECMETIHNIFKLLVTNRNSAIPREEYIGRFFMNIWWIILLVTAAKTRWVLQTSSTNQAHRSESPQTRQHF